MARTIRTKRFCSGDRRRDRISELPDDLLVQILVLLPIVEAVRTCVLSHRWRHVWTRLPRLDFDDDEDAPDVLSFPELIAAAIVNYAADVHLPDVSVSLSYRYEFSEAVSIAASAFLAADRVLSTFDLFLFQDEEDELAVLQAPPLYMPCFPWVKELSFTFSGVNLWMPYIGTFYRLTKMYIFGVRFTDEGWGLHDAVSWRCPCLQDLQLHMIKGLEKVFLISQSLTSLRLFSLVDLERLLVVGANLRDMQVTRSFVHASEPTFMLLDVPKLEQWHWEDRCPDEIQRWSLPNQLSKLTVVEISFAPARFTRILQIFKSIQALSLEFSIAPESAEQKNLVENANISFFHELDLTVKKNEHSFGPTVLSLLNRNYWVRKLSLQITDDREDKSIIAPCASFCNCRKIKSGRDKKIKLDYLNWVTMKNFSGTKDEMNFLYSIVRNAKALHKVSVMFSMAVEPTEKFLQSLQKQSPSGCTIELNTI